MVFGQVVIGPPGSGKTTYCTGMQQYLEALGRKVAVVNLDPANDNYTYPVAVDIHDLVDLDAAAAHCELGPNGALVYCFEYLEANLDWLVEKLAALSDCYVLIDMPGQVQLYAHVWTCTYRAGTVVCAYTCRAGQAARAPCLRATHSLSCVPASSLAPSLAHQVELFTHHPSVRNVLQALQMTHHHRLVAVPSAGQNGAPSWQRRSSLPCPPGAGLHAP